MKMTYVDALNTALTMTTENPEVTERLTALRDSLVKRAQTLASSEKTKAMNEKRKAETKAARDALMAKVLPVIRSAVTAEGKTAEQIYEGCKVNLPEDFSVKKVQYILLHEMANEVVKVDNGRNSKTYKKA